MSAPTPVDESCVVAFEIYGARASVTVPCPELVPQVEAQLPLDSTRRAPEQCDRRFTLKVGDAGNYVLLRNGEVLQRPIGLEGALRALRHRLFWHAVRHARDRLVVHACVVGHEGRAIVLPGTSAIGKTTLAVALVKAGATYYADDFAPLDRDGMAHPRPDRLYIKGERDKVSVESLGGERGELPLPVGLIASVSYRPEARWQPASRTAGDGMLMLLRHAYGMDLPDFALAAARSAAAEAVVVEGERDSAEEAAAGLLEIASAAAARGGQGAGGPPVP